MRKFYFDDALEEAELRRHLNAAFERAHAEYLASARGQEDQEAKAFDDALKTGYNLAGEDPRYWRGSGK